MPLKKGILYTGIVESLAFGGEGVIRIGDFVVFVDGALPQQTVEFIVLKLEKKFGKGKLMRVIARAPNEIPPKCPHFGACGGCRWQTLPYEKQLDIKEAQIRDCLEKIGGFLNPPFFPILPSPEPWAYRNKTEFSFGFSEFVMERLETAEISECIDADGSVHAVRNDAKNGGFIAYHDLRPTLGFHRAGSWRTVVGIDECFLIPKRGNEILAIVRTFAIDSKLSIWNPLRGSGFWRHVMLRSALNGQKWLVLFVVSPTENGREILEPLSEKLRSINGVVGVGFAQSDTQNDANRPENFLTLWGENKLSERLFDLDFSVSPASFFQTNTRGAEKLYEATAKAAKLTGKEKVLDLYCGTGTIGIFLARSAQRIVGLELVPSAIADARKNAEKNGITNTEFWEGSAEKILPEILKQHPYFDCVVVDPPRAGMHPKALSTLLSIKATRIVYVSCNPATLARDLQKLCTEGEYTLESVTPVDMFPHTPHIETVAALVKTSF